MKLIKHLLDAKGRDVESIAPDGSVLDAILKMAEKGIGALLVLEKGALVGIVTERDYARKVILKGRSSEETPVRDIMTADVIAATSDDSVQNCMNMMTNKHCRHLPVVDNGNISGMISIGDLVKAIIADQKEEIEQLGQYISS